MSRQADLLLFRCDAGVALGTGHVMRCLALAQACVDTGGRVAFLVTAGAPSIEARLASEGMTVLHQRHQSGSQADAEETRRQATDLGAAWVVADGYQFGTDYQHALKATGLSLLLLDDYGHAGDYSADIVLNQNLSATTDLYTSRRPETCLLLGPRYALLRREFGTWQGWKRTMPERAARLLITLGGSDPENVTLQVIQALPEVMADSLEVVVVIGGSNPHLSALEKIVQHSSVPIRLEVSAADMPGLMAWADVAVSAGGSTCWEMAMLGLPALLLVLAENQRQNVEELGRRGIMRALGTPRQISRQILAQEITKLLHTTQDRTQMALRGQALVDGSGAARVLRHMHHPALNLRRAGAEDCRQVWKWANDAQVRAVSFTSAPISWEAHCSWFERRLRDLNTALFLAFDAEGRAVGQVRFQAEERDAEVSISVVQEQRGQGFGRAMLIEAIEMFLRGNAIQTLHAFIKPNNAGSQRLFEGARFERLPDEDHQGQDALHYVYHRQDAP